HRQRAVQPLLVGRVIQQVAAEGADAERHRQAPVHGAGQLRAARLTEVRQADRDDEERFEAFPQCDDERLEHGRARLYKMRLRRRINSSVYCGDLRPVKSVMQALISGGVERLERQAKAYTTVSCPGGPPTVPSVRLLRALTD